MNPARLLAASVLAVLVMLAACGGDDDDADPGNDDAPAATSPATADADGNGDDDDEATDAPDATADDGGDDDGNGGSSVDACSLLTPEEVEGVIGEPVEANEADSFNSNASACEWISSDSGNSIFVEVLTEGGAAWFETVNFGQEDEPVEGVGDEANIDFIDVLDVVQGDVFVSVQPILFGTDVDDREAAITLAQLILDRVE